MFFDRQSCKSIIWVSIVLFCVFSTCVSGDDDVTIVSDRGTEYRSSVGGFRNYANDWSSNGGDSKNTRYKRTNKITHPNTFLTNHTFRWNTNSISATAPPVFFSNSIIISTDDGELSARSRVDGSLLWRIDIGVAYYGYYEKNKKSACTSPAIWDRFFLIVGVNYPADFLLVNVLNGDLLWMLNLDSNPHSYFSGGGTVFEDVFYVGVGSDEYERTESCNNGSCCATGSMVAVNLKEGTLKWKTSNINSSSIPSDGFSGCTMSGSTPPVSRGLKMVFAATGGYRTISSDYEMCILDHQGENATELCRAELGIEDLCDSVVGYDLGTGRVVWSRRFSAQEIWNWTCSNASQFVSPNEIFGTIVDDLDVALDSRMLGNCSESGKDPHYEGRMGFDMFPSLSLDCIFVNVSICNDFTKNQKVTLKKMKKIYGDFEYYQRYKWEYELYHPADDYDYVYVIPDKVDDQEDGSRKPTLYVGMRKNGKCVVCREKLYLAQRNGAVISLFAQNGNVSWIHGSAPGGDEDKHSKGLSVDRNAVYLGIYNSKHQNWRLANGSWISGGGWVAHNKTNGNILWTTSNPAFYDPTGPPFDPNSNGRSTYSFGSGVPLIWGRHLFVSSLDAIFLPNMTVGIMQSTNNGWLYLLDKNTGIVESSYQTDVPTAASFSANDNCACVGGGNKFRDLFQNTSTSVTCWCF